MCISYIGAILNSFAKNLRKIMNAKNLTGEKLGELVGVTKATAIHWSNGTRFPKEKHIREVVRALNIKYDDLFIDGAEITTKLIPLIGKSSCGIPKEYELNDYEVVPIPSQMYKDGMYAIEAEGDSMNPKINHGDIVFCDSQRQVDNGNIVHYWLNGESGIKRYKINEAETIISLIPINTEYDIITIHCDDNVNLRMARVVGRIDKDF